MAADGERVFLSDCFVDQPSANGAVGNGALSHDDARGVLLMDAKLRELDGAVLGRDAMFQGPYGERKLVYADWAASGRCLKPVEDYIYHNVLPYYANTHTTTCEAGMQSTCFRQEARQLIAQACNARIGYSDQHADVVVFAGSGSTGAVNRLQMILGLHLSLPPGAQEEDRPVVFVGPYEHHSNILPWRESTALVVEVREDAGGGIDQEHLAELLRSHSHRKLRIGSFSAASNVTGVCSAVDAITEQLHAAGALAFWDYAAAGPYCAIDMNPVVVGPDGQLNTRVYKDAVFLSPHKFPGGVGAPGILVAKRSLFRNAVPSVTGGGTVFFVTSNDHRYLSAREEREEGGTQDIVGSIRAALAFEVKQSVGVDVIVAAEARVVAQLAPALAAHPRIRVMGPPHQATRGGAAARLPIFSFLILAPALEGGGGSMFLHFNFVCALLNDLFGVQSRGGCVCAGPYSISLLGISASNAARIEACLLDKTEVLRPGYTRVSLPYFAAREEVEYIAAAIAAVADHGWRLLPAYRLDPKTGEWRHKSRIRSFPGRQWLSHSPWRKKLAGGSAEGSEPPGTATLPGDVLACQMADGLRLLEHCFDGPLESGAAIFEGGNDAEALRWFMLPSDAAALLAAERTRHGRGCDSLPLSWTPPASASIAAQSPIQPKLYHAATAATAAASGGKEAASHEGLQVGEIQQGTASNGAANGNGVPPVTANNAAAEGAAEPWDEVAAEEDEVQETAEARMEEAAPAQEAAPRAESRKHPLRSAAAPEGAAYCQPAALACPLKPPSPSPHAELGFVASWAKPPPKMVKLITKAIVEWDMIKPGDRLCVGLSGGKDSLAMLHCLRELQRRCHPDRMWSLAAATVDPGTSAFNPRPLIPYMKALGVPYHFLESGIFEMADSHMQGDSICAFCSRMKRGALYTACRTHGYNKLVLGQHLDDQAESFIMSAMHNGRLRVMKASYANDAGDVSVIRPLVYVREKALRDFSYASGLPVINDNCPACYEEPKERQSVKKLLAREEAVFPNMYSSLLNAIVPLMDPTLQDMSNVVREQVYDNNRRRMAARSRPRAPPGSNGNGNGKTEAPAPEENGGTSGPSSDAPAGSESLATLSDTLLLEELARRARSRRIGGAGD